MRHSEQKKVGKPDTEKAASGQAEKAAEQAAEKATSGQAEKAAEQAAEKAASGQAEKAAEQAAEKAAEQARNVNIDVIMRNKQRGSAAHVSFGKNSYGHEPTSAEKAAARSGRKRI